MNKTTFISYRREDSGPEAKLIADALTSAIAPDAVFMDSTSIDFGETWPDCIRLKLLQSDYVLVLIGPDWLKVGMNEWGQRRIDNKTDWVRQEIDVALNDNKKTIIPILIRNAHMPPPDVLPEEISLISSKQAINLRQAYWDHDIKLLVSKIYPPAHKDETGFTNIAQSNPLVDSFWDKLSPSLQDAFSLAANAARREGKDIISTRTLFAALRRIHPSPLPEFFAKIPKESLPEPVSEDIPTDLEALMDIKQFSGCVQDSLNHLTPKSSLDDKLTAEEIFVDIARHGVGVSVKRLRTYGVDPSRINEIVQQLGWSVSERE